MPVAIERLGESPTSALGALVAESEAHGLLFVRRLVDEWTSGANRFDRPGEALFVARSGERAAVGVCGLNRDPYATAEVGRVRHLYVLIGHRRAGVGRQLVERVVEAARGHFARLRLRTGNPAAARLYESVGFRARTDVASSTHVLDLA